VLLGLFFRGYHYLRQPSVWHDEAALLVNVLRLDYREQLGPLIWHEAAPPLFLWAERTMFLAFGSHIQVLRFLPFLASCLSLVLVVPLAKRFLPAVVVPWAVLLVACSDKMAWHGCEAKPYATDVLAAVCVLLAATAARRSLGSRLGQLTLLAPLCIFASYPACFVFGGVLLSLLPEVWQDRGRGVRAGYVALGLAVGVSFLLLALGPVRAQRDEAMESCWPSFFPDWSRPATVPLWVFVNSAEVFRYCFPAAGQILFPLAFLGAVGLWRQGRGAAVALLAGPPLLALLAACLHRYPYGGARVMVYAMPGLAILTAAGLPLLLGWMRARPRLALGVVLVLFTLPGVEAVRRTLVPWGRANSAAATGYVRGHRHSDDPVLGNDWTHAYYLGDLTPYFHPVDGEPVKARGRLWVIYCALDTPTVRLEVARRLGPPGWKVLDQQEFERTTVLLLGRPGAEVATAKP
jgi:hypothetical protein